MIAFTVHGKAQPAGSKRAFVNRKTGRAIVTDDNKKSMPWKQEVAAAADRARSAGHLIHGPIRLQVQFVFARPKGHYGTGRNEGVLKASAPTWHTVKPDATKLLRGVEDALTGVLWRDDAQVVLQAVEKRYGESDWCSISVEAIG